MINLCKFFEMNILYIIGNGLDIAHNMKTSYQDFFKHYVAMPTSDLDILAMKKDIEQHKFTTWADLEEGMGIYTNKCASKDVFLKDLNDIKTSLRDYLLDESKKISLYAATSLDTFIDPGFCLEPEPAIRYLSFVNRFSPIRNIDVITLNYTTTLETILNYKGGKSDLAQNTYLCSIHHLHGALNNMMVMGVNDLSQIANLVIRIDADVAEEFVKPEYNDACMNNKNAICEALINNADMIVLYGTSLGISDKKWWKIIGKRMDVDNSPLLVYFAYDKKKDLLLAPNHLRRWTIEYVREIKNKLGIQLDEAALNHKICVAINKQLFPMTKIVSHHVGTK